MFARAIVNGECKLVANSNKAARQVCPRDGGRVPGIDEEEDGFKCNPHSVTLVAEDFEALVQVTVDAFSKHAVMVVTRENMAVELEQINNFTEHAKEFAVLIKDQGVADAKLHHDLHESGCKSGSTGISNRFSGTESSHTISSNEVAGTPFETRLSASLIAVNVEYVERRVNWKFVNKFAATVSGVCKGTAGALTTKLFTVAEHARPIVA